MIVQHKDIVSVFAGYSVWLKYKSLFSERVEYSSVTSNWISLKLPEEFLM